MLSNSAGAGPSNYKTVTHNDLHEQRLSRRMSQVLRKFRRGITEVKANAVDPCFPSVAHRPPSGPGWLHEIKHDGFRMMLCRDATAARIITRNGDDWSQRFPLMLQAAKALGASSYVIDGEAVACDENGLAVFDRIRSRRHDASVFLYAFDLLHLNGRDLRRQPIQVRKAALARLLRSSLPGIRLVQHLQHEDGEFIFRHACQLGYEGIVSKLIGSSYRSGRTRDWIKMKNPAAPAARREAEEEWH